MPCDDEGDEGIGVYIGRIYHRSSRPKTVMTSSQEIRERIFVAEGPIGKEIRCGSLDDVVRLATQNRATFISDEITLLRALEQRGVRARFYDPVYDDTRFYDRLQELLDEIKEAPDT